MAFRGYTTEKRIGIIRGFKPRMDTMADFVKVDDDHDFINDDRFLDPYVRDICASECLGFCEQVIHLPEEVVESVGIDRIQMMRDLRNSIAHNYGDDEVIKDANISMVIRETSSRVHAALNKYCGNTED